MPLILNYPRFQAIDGNGDPLAGGKVNTYEPGTSTPKATYTDRACATPNANPVVLDANGEAKIWLNGKYKVVLTDSSDVEQWTFDNLGSELPAISAGDAGKGIQVNAGETDWEKTAAFGTGAFVNHGVSIGDLVILESVGGVAGLPAVNGSQLTGLSGIPPAGYKSNLVVVNNATNPTYQVDVDADVLTLVDSSGNKYNAESVDLTLDLTASGADGLDTGSEAVSTLYYLWAIYNGTTVSGLISTSGTAPTMPSGYTYKRLVGEVYNDSGGDLLVFRRIMDRVWFDTPVTIYTAQTITTSFAAYSLPAATPAGCTELSLWVGRSDTGSTAYPDAWFSPDGTTYRSPCNSNVYQNSADALSMGYYLAEMRMPWTGGNSSIHARSGSVNYHTNRNLYLAGYTLPV